MSTTAEPVAAVTRPDALLSDHARAHAGAPALADPPNRASLGFGRARLLTYAEADAIVTRLADHFRELGLKPGELLALQLPNFVEQPLLMLAAWRAGLSVTLLPLGWRGADVREAFAEAPPHAIVVAGKFGDFDYAEMMRHIAADHVSVRRVFALGDHIPDGVTALGEHFVSQAAPTGSGDEAFQTSAPEEPASTPVFIGWTVTADAGVVPVRWGGDELIALGRSYAALLGLGARDVFLTAYPAGSLVGLGLALMPWLVNGGVLLLHHPLDYGVFCAQLRQARVSMTAAPAALLRALIEDGVIRDAASNLARIACVWPSLPTLGPDKSAREIALPVYDVHNIADVSLTVRRRDAKADPHLIPLGRASDGSFETRVRGSVVSGNDPPVLRGDLFLRGAAVPKAASEKFAADGQGFLNTRIRCRVSTGARGIAREPEPDLIRLGGMTLSAAKLDALYSGHTDFLDAAAFALPDAVFGQRLFAAAIARPGIAVSLLGLTDYLEAREAAPATIPQKIVTVREIPRDADGRILRDRILMAL